MGKSLKCKACGVPWERHLGIQHICKQYEDLKAEVERLRHIIGKYGTHEASCGFWKNMDDEDCDCVWPDIVLEFRPEEGE